MGARFPAEPFAPETLPGAAEPIEGVDPVVPAIYRALVTGADAYRATRAGLRRYGRVLRVGNRFVALERYREIAFIALGSAAPSQSLAALAALGESATQGFVAGPDAAPKEVPFRHRTLATGLPGTVDPGVADEALDLARGLGAKDLLLLLLSGGSTGFLAQAPDGMAPEEWARFLGAASRAGASSREVGLLARVLGRGGAGGRLAEATPAEVVALVVDRGDGGALAGGGPVRPVLASERTEARAILERTGGLARVPPGILRALAPDPSAGLPGPGDARRAVTLIGPADALRDAGEVSERKRWRPKLAFLDLDLSPSSAADRFVERTGTLVGRSPELGEGSRPPKGIVTFAATTLAVPDGVDGRGAMAEFLARASDRLPWREASLAVFQTAGGRPGESPPGLFLGGAGSGAASRRGTPRALPMRTGITDVGLVAMALVPRP